MGTRRGPITIEEQPFERKKRYNTGTVDISSAPSSVPQSLTIDSVRKGLLSRQYAFVRASAKHLAKHVELVQFMLLGGALLLVCSVFAITSYVFTVKEEVSAEFGSGYSHLLEARALLGVWDLGAARESAGEAKKSFYEMQDSLEVLGFVSSSAIALDGTAVSANNLLEASVLMVEVMELLLEVGDGGVQFYEDMQTLPHEEMVTKYRSATEYFSFQFAKLAEVERLLMEIEEKLAVVDRSILPQSLQGRLIDMEEAVGVLSGLLQEVAAVRDPVLLMLGERLPMRYVILFQNADEMRPTGGFLGSMLFVEVANGWVTNTQFVDVYDIAGQVDVGIVPPPGLDQLTNRFGLQDANYYPEFADSAEQILWFFDKGGVSSVDGVISVNTLFVEEVLGALGPVVFPVLEQEVTITPDNFTTVLSLLVEAKVDDRTPKVFLEQFLEVFREAMGEAELSSMLPVIQRGVLERHILVYMRDPYLQEFFEKQYMTGQLYVPAEREDYLRIVPTSISGNKSDKYITQRVRHTTEIMEGGQILNEVRIQRTHGWTTDRMTLVEGYASMLGVSLTGELRGILGAGLNRNYTRVYLPAGSELLPASALPEGYNVWVEGAYTVVGFVQETPVAESSEVRLVYQLPFLMERMDRYQLYVEKSSGDRPMMVEKVFLNYGTLITNAIAASGEKRGSGELQFVEEVRDGAWFFALIHLY